MKKVLLSLTVLTALSTATAMAAPINNLAANETAVGLGTNESYIEHKINDDITLGYQYADRDEYGHMHDVYGQIDMISNVKGIVGHRDNLPQDNSNFYAGLAVSTPRVMGAEGYASYITGADFNETQVGVNMNVVANVDLNINLLASLVVLAVAVKTRSLAKSIVCGLLSFWLLQNIIC